jgi:uncharacterized SAM-binding protein YcdF (DUF218 family)
MKTLAALFGAVALWLIGLLVFANHVKSLTPAAEPARADAVVALTGASDARIVEAVRLLEEGKAGRLLVSGVNRQVTRKDIQALTDAEDQVYQCCVDLGFEAETTLGNAQETAAWVRAKRFDSLIVVTSDYHMPRSLLELRGALPGVELRPYPVATRSVNVGTWWRSPKSARLLAWEYTKFLAVGARELVLGLGRRAPEDEAGAAEAPTAA